jgi:hypothetical protein
MVQQHPNTPAQRAQWASQMIAHAGEYGFVTQLSRATGVSRQTLYTWAERGRQALVQAFTPGAAPHLARDLTRQILNLWVDGHASYGGIQTCLRRLTRQEVSLGTIAAVLQDAQQRALEWMASHAPPTSRTLALDELYGNNRRGAYLHIVDTVSYAVWAAEGPLPVDTDSWTLVLWLAQERNLRWHATSSDGGAAIHAALHAVDPDGVHGRDVWHIFQTCAQVQSRLDRRVTQLSDQTATVARQAARVAAGQKPKGPHPRTDVAAHTYEVAHARQIAAGVRYLTGELRRVLEVVVLTPAGLLDRAARQRELDAVLALLAELRDQAPRGQQQESKRLVKSVTDALPALLAFVPALDRVQQDIQRILGPQAMALVAWAWQHRAILGPQPAQLLQGLPASWRAAAGRLLTAWASAVRTSSPAENWHSILRPHLAVHRTLSPGMLALLAVWHNHRVFTRGVHAGSSPLQLSGMPDAPSDWLVALGYPPESAPVVQQDPDQGLPVLALAA